MTEIHNKIVEILQNDIVKAYMNLVKLPIFKEIIKDPACEGKDDMIFFTNFFLQGLLEHKFGVKYLYNKLTKGGYDKTLTNQFIYKLLKLKHKQQNKLWSWEEMCEYNIDYDSEITTTTKYTID